MKSRTIAVALMVSSLLVVAASGQIKTFAEVILQDDASGNYLVINLTTGEYNFTVCQTGFVLGGKAKVSYSGCSITVKDVSETRLVLAEVDLCKKTGRASITLESPAPGPPTREWEITDSNTRNSVAECSSK